MLLGSTLESGFFLQGAMILGAAFFWYCVGWVIDCALGLVPRETPPRFVTLHMRGLRVAGAILFPFGLLRGLQVGNYFCANNKPPYWSELLMYGIGMVWISLGASFELLRFLRSRTSGTSRPESKLRFLVAIQQRKHIKSIQKTGHATTPPSAARPGPKRINSICHFYSKKTLNGVLTVMRIALITPIICGPAFPDGSVASRMNDPEY